MAITSQIIVVGHLVRNPELRTVRGGKSVVSITVAAQGRVRNKETNQWEDGDTLFMRCSAWDEMAENINSSLTKGSRVVVAGTLKESHYKDGEGKDRTSMELQIDEIGVTLKYHIIGPAQKRSKRLPPPDARPGAQDADGWTTVDDDDTPF